MPPIEFTRPWLTGSEAAYVQRVLESGRLYGRGEFNARCEACLIEYTGSPALLTPSCTHALELAAMTLEIRPGDEVILPSFTFVSTANAFVLRGAVPVFVDIRPDTLNLDETRIEEAVSERTRAIVPMHYAGVSCDMTAILAIARRLEIAVVEDAAHGIDCRYRGQPLGSIGDLGCLSFGGQKNVTCGEGGTLLVNDDRLMARAEIAHDKGTNRAQFARGDVDHYSWVGVGSSLRPSEVTAALLLAQLEHVADISHRRRHIWNLYREGLTSLAASGDLQLPVVPSECEHSGHLFYVLLARADQRRDFLAQLKSRQIEALFHYVPLHSSLAGRRYGRVGSSMSVTEDIADRLVRLPLHTGMTDPDVEYVVDAVTDAVAA
jgi:dTDP-4-amino-4,6-dideoxygalactose transaminase